MIALIFFASTPTNSWSSWAVGRRLVWIRRVRRIGRTVLAIDAGEMVSILI
jgi:hypothetical protein